MRNFDGSFSEGSNTNAMGLLGLTSTSILWVYPSGPQVRDTRGDPIVTVRSPSADPFPDDDAHDQASVDAWFQRHVRMNVFPMAPFPDNDHAIEPSASFDADYLRYGPLFNAIKGTSWLLEAVPISLVPSPTAVGMQTNAFVAANMTTFLYPIVLAHPNATVVEVEINVPSVLSDTARWSVLHPSAGAVWQPIHASAGSNAKKVTITVPLVSGCALLRAE